MMTMVAEEDLEKEFVPKISEIYKVLMQDALSVAQTLIQSVRHFLYFCLSLIIFCVVFAALGFYFFLIPGNFQAAVSIWVMALLVAFYALILWMDYSRMHERFAQLFALRKRIEEELEKSKRKVKP